MPQVTTASGEYTHAYAAPKTVAVVGLERLGGAVARQLLRAGFDVLGLDENAALVAAFQEAGGITAELEAIAPEIDLVILAVECSEALERWIFGPCGIGKLLPRGRTIVVLTVAPPAMVRLIDAAARLAGLRYLDAPTSGGVLGASRDELLILASGSDTAYASAMPVLKPLARKIIRVGQNAGEASAMKAVCQATAAINLMAVREALALGRAQGITPEDLLAVLSESQANSAMLQSRLSRRLAGDDDVHFPLDRWVDNLGATLDFARDNKVTTPVLATAAQQYLAAVHHGMGDEDDSAILFARPSRS